MKAEVNHAISEMSEKLLSADKLLTQSRLKLAAIDEHRLDPWFSEIHEYLSAAEDDLSWLFRLLLKAGVNSLLEIMEHPKVEVSPEVIESMLSWSRTGSEELLEDVENALARLLNGLFSERPQVEEEYQAP